MSPQWLVIPPAALLLVLLPLVFWARRGRRVDDHSLCRKCGFDLFGKPADSTRCPECGRDVTTPRALRIGNRQPRRRLLAGMSPFIVLPALWLGLLGYGTLVGTDWNRHKPVGWLIREAQGPDLAVRDRALVELLRRVDEAALSADQIADVADAALAHQADRQQPWLVAWGNLVERLHDKSRLPADRWSRYAKQAIEGSLSLYHRDYARRGESLLVQVHTEPPRLSAAKFWVQWDSQDTAPDDFSGHPVAKTRQHYDHSFAWPAGAAERNLSCGLFSPPPELSDGPQTLRVSLNLKMYDRAASPEPIVTECLQLHADWELHPKTDPPVRLRRDPSLQEAMAKSVTLAAVTARVGPNSEEVMLQLRVGPRPVYLAVTPILRSGSQEWPCASDEPIRGRKECGFAGVATARIDGHLPDQVDVVLRPYADHVKGNYSVWEIWGDEIVIPNVKVEREKVVTSE